MSPRTVRFLDLAADTGNGSDADVDGDALTITSIDGTTVSAGDTVALSSGVRVTFQGGTSVVVDGPIQTLGTFVETFDYDVSDGNGGTDSATVSLDLTVNALSVAGSRRHERRSHQGVREPGGAGLLGLRSGRRQR